MGLYRAPQLRGAFTPGDPHSGYYNDLRSVAREYGSALEAHGWLDLLMHRRSKLWPVRLTQLGLGAWQLFQDTDDQGDWASVVQRICTWAVTDMDAHGRIAHELDMPHTYPIAAPWHSAMIQGQLASLLVRASSMSGHDYLQEQSLRACASLMDPALGLCAATEHGIVLEEYPADPPPHVLNGWIWALWGFYDVGAFHDDARRAFEQGCATLAALLPAYELASGWTRYDLYPHPLVNVASPFYHQLHIQQMDALHVMTGDLRFAEAAERWQRAFDRRSVRAIATIRKVGFRMLRPRARSVA